MPSSKGKPTDPKLREEAKEEVKNMEKGGGKGSWSAWKAAEMSKRYEAKGGGYEDSGDNPNEASKGAPKPKQDAIDKGERKDPNAPVGEKKKPDSKNGATAGDKRKAADDKKDDDGKEAKKEEKKKEDKAPKQAPEPKEKKQKKEPKEPAKGTRTQPSRGAKK